MKQHLKKTNHQLTLLAAVMLAGINMAFAQATVLPSPSGLAKAQQCSAATGQLLIDQGRYDQAIREFTCLIESDPTDVEGYRGRAEAQLLLGRYSDVLGDYARITAFVLPAHPDAMNSIFTSYTARLAIAPNDIPALTGLSFARWASFDYAQAIHVLNHLLEVQPGSLYGNLFRGSSRLLRGATRAQGIADLEQALALAPQSADVRFIVSDAYTYGEPDAERAFAEATLALTWGLDTPRVHAILASAYHTFGDEQAAAIHLQRHFELVTTETLTTVPLTSDASFSLDLVPGRTFEIPVAAIAGETISIATSSHDFYDSILVLLAPDGTPVVGSDDENAYFAAIDWVAEQTGTYRLLVTSFESINTGELIVIRD
jgi:tetratricopeptide (TPR) repeat protein